jgi:serine/threonine-protein kinase
MNPEDQLIDDLAQAVLDGDTVDWDTATPSAGSAKNLIRHLKVVATLAELHRGISVPRSAADSKSFDPPLETWGHLRVGERIGRGAFGVVYRAWDTRLDREVALKLIPAQSDTAAAAASTIIREGRLLARVRHPNVATIYGADRIDGHVGLWMEFVHGRTLEELLREGTRFEPGEVIRIGVELGRALAAVHAAGLLHRDIKAQNVMRADDGRIVLMDFGTGRELADEESDLTGTPLYLAPELFDGQPATIRSDIYSLGVLLYHLLTASYPVEGKTIREVREAHKQSAREDLRTTCPDVPARLARVVERATDPRPEQRYSTTEAFGADLHAAATRPRRGRWWSAAAILLTVAAIGLVSRREMDAILPAGDKPVIAVLFENEGVGINQDVTTGFNIEMVRQLGGIRGLSVRSAAPPSGDRDSPDDVKELGGQLGANLVLRGSMSQATGTLRVDARLVSVTDGVIHWTYGQDNDDLLAVQSQISEEIAGLFDFQPSVGRYQTDRVLYNMFLRGQSLMAQREVNSSDAAASIFWDVYSREQSFTPALAEWARSLSFRSRRVGQALDPKVPAAARTAVERDADLAEAHAAMGWVYAHELDWDKAKTSFSTALKLDPNLTTIHTDYVTTTLWATGDMKEALRVMTDAFAVNRNSLDVRKVLGHTQMSAGLQRDAIENFQWVIGQDPKYPEIHLELARAFMLDRQPLEAIRLLEARAKTLGGLFGLAYTMVDREDAKRLAAARLIGDRMFIYAGLNDFESAFGVLEELANSQPWHAAVLLNVPEMRMVRESTDPRVVALKKRLRQPQ